MVNYEIPVADYELIRNELINGEDDEIISGYLEPMIVFDDHFDQHFIEDVDVYNKNPSESLDPLNPTFVIVKPGTENCGKTDGCESGCWRIMGRDKLVRSKQDINMDQLLGFKKILKLCVKSKPREYKRNWVMEEYRVTDKLNWKQDHVICKIRLMFEKEISFLLTKHFSYLPRVRTKLVEPLPTDQLFLPAYGNLSHVAYLRTIMESDGNKWPDYVTNDVYRLHPLTLVDPKDRMFMTYGICIFTNRTETSGVTDECDAGCWRKILGGDRLIKSDNGEIIMGIKRYFRFCEKQEHKLCKGKDWKATWIIEEYKLLERMKLNKVLCVLKLIANH